MEVVDGTMSNNTEMINGDNTIGGHSRVQTDAKLANRSSIDGDSIPGDLRRNSGSDLEDWGNRNIKKF